MYFASYSQFKSEKALEIIALHHHKNFIIYSDSKSVLEVLQSNSCSLTYTSVLEYYNELLKKGYCIFSVGYLGTWALKVTKLLIKLPKMLSAL